MKRKNLIILVISLVLLFLSALFYFKNSDWFSAEKDTSIILYVQDGCSHCEIVEEYIDSNQINSKIVFLQKNITNNQFVINELISKAKFCGFSNNEIGTPFLWNGENSSCLVGDVDIINFFEERIK